jgi:hypothetical protein
MAKAPLSEFDAGLLEQLKLEVGEARTVAKLRGHEGWAILERVLQEARRFALEQLFNEPRESREQYIGFAKAINFLLNYLDEITLRGKVSEGRMRQLVHIYREAEEREQLHQATSRYRGHGGI